MQKSEFHKSAARNIRMVQDLFEGDATLKVRTLRAGENPGCTCALLFLDGLVNVTVLNDAVLQPLSKLPKVQPGRSMMDTVKESGLFISFYNEITTLDELKSEIMLGSTLLFVDGSDSCLAVDTKGWSARAISEPESERVLRGPREGFVETMMVNVSMIRRRLATTDLKFELQKLGRVTRTNLCICYIKGLVEPGVLRELKRRLGRVSYDSVVDSNYINELIRDNPRSPFRPINTTERPDVVAAKLLEGRIAVVVDGSPVVLTLPCLYSELMQSPDDYYLNYYYASFGRLMRMFSAFLCYSVPAIYLALITFHQELIPTPLLISIAKAREGVPLPSVLEALILLLAFDLLRETGVRTPASIGQALSIVGALVLGQSAVEARFVSAPMIIVVAISGVTSLIVPRISGALDLIKYPLLILSSLFGLYGYAAGFITVLAILYSMNSFGVPYMAYSSMLGVKYWQDIYLRAPWPKIKRRPFFSRNRDRYEKEVD